MHYKLSYPLSTVLWDGKKISNIPKAEIEKQLDLLQDSGIDEVMLAGYHDEEPATFDMFMETEIVGDLLRRRGMRAAQHHGVVPSFVPNGFPQTEVIRRMKNCVDYTINLNADVLVFHIGRPLGFNLLPSLKAEFERQTQKYGFENVRSTIVDNLQILGDYAKKKGILIAIENIDDNEPLSDLATLPQLIRLVDHEAVGFCLDSGHCWCKGYSLENWISKLGDKLFTTHIHDNHGISASPGPHDDEHLPPGFGTIPWRDAIAGFIRCGYRRTLNFESGPWPLPNLREGYDCAIRYWRICENLAEELLKGNVE